MPQILTSGQARARGQYDEQLQRQLQEKKLAGAAEKRETPPPAFFGTAINDIARM